MDKPKLLFIGVGFHEYDTYIIEHLKGKYDVWYLCSSGFNNKHPYIHFISLKLPVIFPNFNDQSITNFIEKTKNANFDVVFTIKGSNLTDFHLCKLKTYHPQAKFKLYVWDEWEYMSNRDILKKHFSEIYSFDSDDCERYGFILRPLFYINDNKDDSKIYDISFVGNEHTNRFQTILEIKKVCVENGLRYRFVVTMTKSSFMKLKSCYSEMDYADIALKGSIPYGEYQDIIRKSKTVIDIPRETQSGITMRTLEALATCTKVITTSKHIKQYSNIPKEMYYEWDYKVSDSLIDFIKNPIPKFQLDSYYSIDVFLEQILK